MAQRKPPSTIVRTRKPQVWPRHLLSERNVMIGFLIICVLALAVFAMRASARSAALNAGRPDVTNAALVAHGQRIYATRCASCHGSDLKGEAGWPQRRSNGVMPAAPLDQSGHAWRQDDQWLFTTIQQGGQATAAAGFSSSMPALGGGMTSTDIWAVISYIKSTWPKHPQDVEP